MIDDYGKFKFESPPPTTWECELFGCGNALVLHRPEGQVPNWFWRLMQYLIFGNKWRRKP
jgi:hypothetical protein